jgi:OOP family OmpA-OmpF porin
VSGLRDPLARDPASLLSSSGLTVEDVEANWNSYYAASPSLAVARARQVLQPPSGVTLDLKDGVLSTSGSAPLSWLVDAGRLAPLIPGVSKIDATASLDAAARDEAALMEGLSPLFAKGQAVLAREQDDVLRRLVARTADMKRTAEVLGSKFQVDLVGHTDADGVPEANLPLSRARAAFIKAALQPVAGEWLDIVAIGVGSDDPIVQSDRESDKQRNRRVTVRVTPVARRSPSNDVRP